MRMNAGCMAGRPSPVADNNDISRTLLCVHSHTPSEPGTRRACVDDDEQAQSSQGTGYARHRTSKLSSRSIQPHHLHRHQQSPCVARVDWVLRTPAGIGSSTWAKRVRLATHRAAGVNGSRAPSRQDVEVQRSVEFSGRTRTRPADGLYGRRSPAVLFATQLCNAANAHRPTDRRLTVI